MLCDVLTRSHSGNNDTIPEARELIRDERMAALSGGPPPFISPEGNVVGEGKTCPVQKSNLDSTSSVWPVCCSLGQTTQTDRPAQVNIVFLRSVGGGGV